MMDAVSGPAGLPEQERVEMAKVIGQVTTSWNPDEAKNKAQTHLTAAGADMKGDVAILGPNDATARSIALDPLIECPQKRFGVIDPNPVQSAWARADNLRG